MKQVAVWPSPWNYQPQNRMFEAGYGPGRAYLKAFRLWRSQAQAAGFQLDTWDVVDLKKVDVLWFIDLPRHKKIFDEARRQAPQAKVVLMVCESPLICPQMFMSRHRQRCDLVVTYERRPVGNPKSIRYALPVDPAPALPDLSFRERRLLCVVNSNRVEGWFAVRQPGWEGLPGIGGLFGGWGLGLRRCLRPAEGELYSARRRLARAADRRPQLEVDFFGRGWRGEQISWCPLYPKPAYRCAGTGFVEDRLAKVASYRFNLAFENWQGDRGYVTDRIFDGFHAGTVPVYRGDESVETVFPPNSFVDARKFREEGQLLEFLAAMPESRWEAMRRSARTFLASDEAKAFSNEAFAETMVAALRSLPIRG